MNIDAKSNKVLSKIGQKILCNDVLRVHWVDKEEAEVVVKDTVDYGISREILRLSDILTVEDDDEVTVQKQGRGLKSLPSSTSTSTSSSSSSSASTSSIIVCGEISMTNQWNLSTQFSSKIFKKDKSSRKQPYVDLLVAKELALKGASQQGGSSSSSSSSGGSGGNSSSGGKGGGGGVGMHEGGFATLYRLMAGEQVGCPLCLEVSHLLTHSLIHSLTLIVSSS